MHTGEVHRIVTLHSSPRRSMKKALTALMLTALSAVGSVAVVSGSAGAASGATFTTDKFGQAVNANQYRDKCDVYLNGGPDGAKLSNGTWFFAILRPGGQSNPEGAGLLSNDARANRTFSVSSGVVSYSGTHPTSIDRTNGEKLIDACIPAATAQGYADTPNPGGVYIAAICANVPNPRPSDCKYDAFKVNKRKLVVDLVALKSANPSYSKTYGFAIDKTVDRHNAVGNYGGSATFNYGVAVTKDAGVNSNYTVSGEVTVFNPNDTTVSGVSVTDTTLGAVCVVTGGSSSISALSQVTFNYTCDVSANATPTTSATNTAIVSWSQASIGSPSGSTTATAGYDFGSVSPTVYGDCTTVTDQIGLRGGTPDAPVTLGTTCASTNYNYSRTIPYGVSGCQVYDNTARLSSGASDSESVQVCTYGANGKTIGFWQNKNGQAIILANGPGMCSNLSAFGNVLSLPSPCNATTLANYYVNVFNAANASGDGVAMFRAQFFASAMNAYMWPDFAGYTVSYNSSCMTVNQLLAYANANFSSLSANKTNLMAVKDIFDRLNNNIQPSC